MALQYSKIREIRIEFLDQSEKSSISFCVPYTLINQSYFLDPGPGRGGRPSPRGQRRVPQQRGHAEQQQDQKRGFQQIFQTQVHRLRVALQRTAQQRMLAFHGQRTFCHCGFGGLYPGRTTSTAVRDLQVRIEH